MWNTVILEKVICKADKAGLQYALHVIGGKAITLAIDALTLVDLPDNRHRIKYLKLSTLEDI